MGHYIKIDLRGTGYEALKWMELLRIVSNGGLCCRYSEIVGTPK
jgi:hypothetical protein